MYDLQLLIQRGSRYRLSFLFFVSITIGFILLSNTFQFIGQCREFLLLDIALSANENNAFGNLITCLQDRRGHDLTGSDVFNSGDEVGGHGVTDSRSVITLSDLTQLVFRGHLTFVMFGSHPCGPISTKPAHTIC